MPIPVAQMQTFGGLDAFLAVVLLYFFVRAYTRGLLATLVSFVSPVVAGLAALRWAGLAAEVAAESLALETSHTILTLFAFPVLFFGTAIALRVLTSILSSVFDIGMSIPSRLAAAMLGGIVGATALGVVLLLIQGATKAHTAEIGSRSVIGEDTGRALAAVSEKIERSPVARPLMVLGGRFVVATADWRRRAMESLPLDSLPTGPTGGDDPSIARQLRSAIE